eukprot:2024362-Pyramimonas_sp.AAC.1
MSTSSLELARVPPPGRHRPGGLFGLFLWPEGAPQNEGRLLLGAPPGHPKPGGLFGLGPKEPPKMGLPLRQ